jgi:hypothetical protein
MTNVVHIEYPICIDSHRVVWVCAVWLKYTQVNQDSKYLRLQVVQDFLQPSFSYLEIHDLI